MDEKKIAQKVAELELFKIAEKSEKQKKYQEYFNKMLKKYKVKSPDELPKDKKDDFFNEVDEGYDAENETD